MRVLLQRVIRASVSVGGKQVSAIDKGLLVLLGVSTKDTADNIDKMVRKVLRIKLWPAIQKEEEKKEDPEAQEETKSVDEKEPGSGKQRKELAPWRSNVADNNFEILVVSQFTLFAILNGTKPDFHSAMPGPEAKVMYEEFLARLGKEYNPDKIKGGAFGEYMNVELVNDGPVTIWIDSEKEGNGDDNSEKEPKSAKSSKSAKSQETKEKKAPSKKEQPKEKAAPTEQKEEPKKE